MKQSSRSDGGASRWPVWLAVALVASACEHVVTLRGQAVVPVDIQQQFSKEAPGLLLFGGGAGKFSLGADLLAVLCDPTDKPLEVPFQQARFDCASEGTVWFRVTRLSPTDKDALACGIEQQNFDALVNGGKVTWASSDKVVAAAMVTVFEGQGARCRSGEQTIQVTLAAPPP